jgi:isoleucyl-tRNA synthetase
MEILMAEKPDVKSTLNLPRTDFSMKASLAQKEPEAIKKWEADRLYEKILEKRAAAHRTPYILHDGPPYANNRIHLGTALNKILKDFIVKSRSMLGYYAPYVPGWDCHGLPIEIHVDKHLGDKKKTMSVTAVREECRKYAEKYIGVQRDEFKRLGVLGAWETPYLTMHPAYEAKVLEYLGVFFEQGEVFKGKRPVHWCVNCRTALAEAEIEYPRSTSASPSSPTSRPSSRPSPAGAPMFSSGRRRPGRSRPTWPSPSIRNMSTPPPKSGVTSISWPSGSCRSSPRSSAGRRPGSWPR